MIIALMATTLPMRHAWRGMRVVNVLVQDFLSFTLHSPWELVYEPTD
jgi:hypothetical protein